MDAKYLDRNSCGESGCRKVANCNLTYTIKEAIKWLDYAGFDVCGKRGAPTHP